MLTIALPPEIEQRLQGEASRRGVGAEELAVKMITDNLTQVPVSGTLKDLFAEWADEDKTSDPAELSKRCQDAEDLKAAINRNRKEMEGPDARTPFQ
jgi:hypothetical protein